jgi:hypothetical protein
MMQSLLICPDYTCIWTRHKNVSITWTYPLLHEMKVNKLKETQTGSFLLLVVDFTNVMEMKDLIIELIYHVLLKYE